MSQQLETIARCNRCRRGYVTIGTSPICVVCGGLIEASAPVPPPPEKCLKGYCRSPVACNAFGYCRERNMASA